MLHGELACGSTVRARFVREAYVANTIEHEGAVRVIEDGVDEEDVPYLVIELLRGENYETRRVRKGGRLPINEVLWVADRTLAVLAEAHAKGIVHRDIKPENLFLTDDRRLKVLDFGIARLADQGTTHAGTILGTLAFMPPEQARGANAEIGVRSDLWSVGATMYTLLSGRLVRDDHDVAKLLREAGRTEVPSLGQVVDDLPGELVELVSAALLLDQKVRWPSARAMRRAVCFVHATTKHGRGRAAHRDAEDEEAVSDPSFGGFLGVESIAPPPPSVGYEDLRDVAPLAPALPDRTHHDGPTLQHESVECSIEAPPTSFPTLPSLRAMRAPRVALDSAEAPASGSVVSLSNPDSGRQATTVRTPKRSVPGPPDLGRWMGGIVRVAWVAVAAALFAAAVLLALLVRR